MTTSTKPDYVTAAETLLESLGMYTQNVAMRKGYHFPGDNQERAIYTCIFSRRIKPCKDLFLTFGQSISNTARKVHPTSYDLICCLTKEDPESFEDFCSNYGYDDDSRKAYKIYEDVRAEWYKVKAFFTQKELELLKEIY